MEIIKILTPLDKKILLNNFNSNNSLWICSDIKSQIFILDIISKNKHINKKSIIRAKNYWSMLLAIIQPNKKIISRCFLTLIYEQWSCSQNVEWQKNKNTGELLCSYMDTLVHLLQHPLKDSLIQEWQKNKSNKDNYYWIKWYKLASDFWSYLESQNIIETSWVSTLLLDNIPFNNIKVENIIFDLGFDVNRIEIELIKQIATKIKVKVLMPNYNTPFLNNTNFVYNFLDPKHITKNSASVLSINTHSSVKIKKFITPLAEVKDITHQITLALNKGIKPNKISVLVPNIEEYWICLKSYLKKQDIPVNKQEVVLLCYFPSVQLWLAKLWTHLSIIKYENLETLLSHHEKYTNFNKLKSEFYNVTELNKWPSEIYETTNLKNKDTLITAAEFTQWTQKLLPRIDTNSTIYTNISHCLKNILYLKTLRLKWSAWLQLLETYLKKIELIIDNGDLKGINCLSFNAISWVESEFIYIAGLSEQNLKTEKHNAITSLEADFTLTSLGFFIKHKPIDKSEHIISHFINQQHKQMVLSFSSTDFLGTPVNPSCLWLQKAMQYKKDIKHCDTPGTTLWDTQQQLPDVQNILSYNSAVASKNIVHSDSQIKLIKQSINEDLGNVTLLPFAEKNIKNISPSVLNDYIRCPFILASKKLFCLSDTQKKNKDIPLIEHGNIVHKLFEVLQKKQNTQLSEVDITKIIQKIICSKPFVTLLKTIHPIIIQKEISYLLNKSIVFLKQEINKNLIFKKYLSIAYEKEFKCYWNFNTLSLASKGDIGFTGKIDRIDCDNQSYHIIDYKRTLPTGATIPYWETHQNFQMALYIQALEYHLTTLPSLPVNSALYLSYKDFQCKGFAIKNPQYTEFLGGSRKTSLTTETKKQSILQNVSKKINSVILNIYNGNFNTNPKTKLYCTKCKWSNICRAKHLN